MKSEFVVRYPSPQVKSELCPYHISKAMTWSFDMVFVGLQWLCLHVPSRVFLNVFLVHILSGHTFETIKSTNKLHSCISSLHETRINQCPTRNWLLGKGSIYTQKAIGWEITVTVLVCPRDRALMATSTCMLK